MTSDKQLTLARVLGLLNRLEGLQQDLEVRCGLAVKADMAACHIQVACKRNLQGRATRLSIKHDVLTTSKRLHINPETVCMYVGRSSLKMIHARNISS